MSQINEINSAEVIQARPAPVQVPVAWEWRWFDDNPNTVTFGQWSEWKRVEPRNALCTVEDSVNEFKTYIAKGCRYELRELFTKPQANQSLKTNLIGLKISVDMSTGDHDAGNRLFGTVTDILDTNPVTLLCDDARPNFNPARL